MREILKQPQYAPLRVAEQISALLAVTTGGMDRIPLESISQAESLVREAVTAQYGDLCGRIEAGEKMGATEREAITGVIGKAVESLQGE